MWAVEKGAAKVHRNNEAHNIDDICLEALSVELNTAKLRSARSGIEKLRAEIGRMKHEVNC